MLQRHFAKSNRRSLQPRVGVEDEEEESRKSVTMSLNRAKLENLGSALVLRVLDLKLLPLWLLVGSPSWLNGKWKKNPEDEL